VDVMSRAQMLDGLLRYGPNPVADLIARDLPDDFVWLGYRVVNEIGWQVVPLYLGDPVG
jgi:hypothetical protein